MISESTCYAYCREDLSLIENYDKAVGDKIQSWDCHHRLEIQNKKLMSKKELIELGLYYNRPANELIFLTKKEHHSLHSSNLSEETLKKRSLGLKGKKNPMYGKQFSKEHKEKLSKAHIDKKPWNIGKKLNSNKMKWFNNGVINIRDEFCPDGYVPGRIKYEINFNKFSKIAKGTKWFNNGVVNVRAKECPEGYVLGRLPLPKEHGEHISIANKGIKCWNNGKVTVKRFECPEGFVRGMVKK